MSPPATQKQWLIQGTDKGLDGLLYQDAPVPKVGDDDVLVKMHGASLNYRDLLIPKVPTLLPRPPYLHPLYHNSTVSDAVFCKRANTFSPLIFPSWPAQTVPVRLSPSAPT